VSRTTARARGPLPPLWGEGFAVAEGAALRLDPVFWGAGLGPGRGRPVLLLPGFMTADQSLATMATWLRRGGYRPIPTGLGPNVGCAGALVDTLAARVAALADEHAERVAIIGHSRGGCLARALGVRLPDRIAGVIALGSPLLDVWACHPSVRAAGDAVVALGDRGVPGLMTSRCIDGTCCRRYHRELLTDFPPRVHLLSVHSKRDSIVDWRTTLDPCAQHVEVSSTHIGMNSEASTYRAIARALRSFWPDPA
jgi:triacylglycerol lipase